MSREPSAEEALVALDRLQRRIFRLSLERRDVQKDLKHIGQQARGTRRAIRENIDRLTEQRRLLRGERELLRKKRSALRVLRKMKRDSIQEIREISSRLKEIDPPRGSYDRVLDRARRLEERFETGNTDPLEEKSMMQQIRRARETVALHEEWTRGLRRQTKLKERLDSLRPRIWNLEREISETHEKVRQLQEAQDSLIQAGTQLQVSLNEAQQEHNIFRTRSDEIHAKLTGNKSKKQAILGSLDITDSNLSPDQVRELLVVRDERARSATDKLRQRKSLTFDEFKALVEKGLV
ncbi:MAG: hypothetical protein ACE5IB_02595 [Candidatus Geothermarchaeales archaeon]